jgi:hypothetical protein
VTRNRSSPEPATVDREHHPVDVTPRGAHSFASALVSPAIPDLAAVYPGTLTPPWKLSSDAVKTTLPLPRSSIGRATAWVSANCAVRRGIYSGTARKFYGIDEARLGT